MEEIKVGEYVRTKKYGIKKIDHLAVNPNVTVNKYRYYLGLDEDGDRCYGILKTTDIVKHSENILDLIEVGDYVNGKKVSNVDKIDNKEFIEWEDGDMYSTEILNDKFIKSIVTKEQFSSVEYRLEEGDK